MVRPDRAGRPGPRRGGACALTNAAAAVYSLPAGDFHDITSGGNGYSAAPGYDLATGRGSPRADLVIAGLVEYGGASSNHVSTSKTAKPSPAATSAHAAAAIAAGSGSDVLDARADWASAERLRDLHAVRRPDDDFRPLHVC